MDLTTPIELQHLYYGALLYSTTDLVCFIGVCILPNLGWTLSPILALHPTNPIRNTCVDVIANAIQCLSHLVLAWFLGGPTFVLVDPPQSPLLSRFTPPNLNRNLSLSTWINPHFVLLRGECPRRQRFLRKGEAQLLFCFNGM